MNAIAPNDVLGLLARQAGASAAPLPSDLAAQLASADPVAALLANLLTQNAPEVRPDEVEEPDGYDDIDGQELLRLREISAMLASALGACDLCWGTEIDCSACRGAGSPGAFPPDPDLFREVVGPAARRMRWIRAQKANDITRRRSE
jgi:hypothetical protein